MIGGSENVVIGNGRENDGAGRTERLSMTGWSALTVAVAVAGAAVAVAVAVAAPIPLPSQGRFVVFDEPVSEVLSRFCQATTLRCVIDPTIAATIRGHFGASTPREFLDRITEEYHIDAYDDGAALYLTPSSASAARSFSLDGVSYAELARQLRVAGIWEDRFPVRTAVSGRVVNVFGPPHLLELVGQTITEMKSPTQSTVTIIRGSSVENVTEPK